MREKINHLQQWLHQKGIRVLIIAAVTTLVLPLGASSIAAAAENPTDFNIQVSPSPLVVTLTPGKAQKATLSVRNVSNHAETLYPKLNGFSIDKKSRNIKLIETPPVNMQSWVTFTDSTLNIPAGATKQLTASFNTPQDVGFNYSAAITLARSQDNPIEGDGVRLRGAVAVFCLININRPDAKRELKVPGLTTDKSRYQFLPVTFELTVQNAGNIIDQPSGSLFIQRSFDDETPIVTLPINAGSNYVLSGTERNFSVTWNSGFPSYRTGADGQQHLSWDWKHLNEVRFGRYVAKAVVVYNDGQRDVPVIVSKSFWVIPWTVVIVGLVVLTILIMGVIGWGRVIFKGTRKVKHYATHRK